MKSKLLWFSVGLFILASCATSNSVNNGFITKRKHNKGFHINLNKNKGDVAVNKNNERKVEKEINLNDENHSNSNDKFALTSEKDTESLSETKNKANKVVNNEKKASPNKGKKASLPDELDRIIKHKKSSVSENQNTSPRMEATNKIKEQQKNKSKNSNEDKVLLVILCFLLPPLAVYLHEGSWTSRCTINLILTLLCGLPGVIHALIVVLE